MSTFSSSLAQIKRANDSGVARVEGLSEKFVKQVEDLDKALDSLSDFEKINLRFYVVTFKRQEDIDAFLALDSLIKYLPAKQMNPLSYVYTLPAEVDLLQLYKSVGATGYTIFEVKREVAVAEDGLPYVYPAFMNQYDTMFDAEGNPDTLWMASLFIPTFDEGILSIIESGDNVAIDNIPEVDWTEFRKYLYKLRDRGDFPYSVVQALIDLSFYIQGHSGGAGG